MDFLDFLNVMRGRYEHATFQEKRNALEVLGVRVVVHEPVEAYGLPSDASDIAAGQEWFSAKEAGRLLGVHAKTIRFYQKNGTITNYKEEPFLLVHRDELLKLQKKRLFTAQYGGDCAQPGGNQLFPPREHPGK